MASGLRAWDWELEAAALAAPTIEGESGESRITDPAMRTQLLTAIRLTVSAWCLVHREAPSARGIAALLADDDRTAWLMENAMRTRPRDADERDAVKEIGAWYKQEWRLDPRASAMASGRLHYDQQQRIKWLVEAAANKAGERGNAPLEQLEHGSAERRRTAAELGIDDPAEHGPEGEASSFTAEAAVAAGGVEQQPERLRRRRAVTTIRTGRNTTDVATSTAVETTAAPGRAAAEACPARSAPPAAAYAG